MTVNILVGDCREMLATLSDASVQCCVTSPPYFGLRDYGHDGQIGLEPTPGAYVAEMVAVFREVRRVLRPDGVCWINLGDSYAGNGQNRNGLSNSAIGSGPDGACKQRAIAGAVSSRVPAGLKPKDLIGIPWRVAFALQADGWYLRSEIIWHKPNPMPESVTDRPTKAHEQVFLLSKSPRYFWDAKAIAEPATYVVGADRAPSGVYSEGSGRNDAGGHRSGGFVSSETRNRRSVWTIATQPFSGAHFATMPPELAETCIKAGSSEKGQCPHCGAPWVRQVVEGALRPPASRPDAVQCHGDSEGTRQLKGSAKACFSRERTQVGWSPSCACPEHQPVPQMILDPFGGAGTTALVADRLQRDCTIIELNPAYAALARERINGEAGMFSPVAAE